MLMMIDELNHRYGIPGIAKVLAGTGNLPMVRITTPAASAEVYLHGAQVTAWKPANSDQVIFLSEHSRWEDGRAIRGGIPVCFPWFRAKADNPQAPAHGFVRTKEWRLADVTATDDAVLVVLSTESDESTRRWWPHEFRITNRIRIGKVLRMELLVTNTGSTTLRFEEALHTYFRVSDARSVRVRGLDQVTYLDNTDSNRAKLQTGDLSFVSPTDNAYIDSYATAELIDPDWHRIVRTEKGNSATTVVWNPWQQGASSLSDLGDDEWQHMACIEASNILSAAVSLAPGQEHSLHATLSIVSE
jgi:glucose-6-phosphate 1-epimerase